MRHKIKINDFFYWRRQAVIRCIVAYLTVCPLDDVPYIDIPLHTVVKVTMKNGQVIIKTYVVFFIETWFMLLRQIFLYQPFQCRLI